jgi:hypothetical protein
MNSLVAAEAGCVLVIDRGIDMEANEEPLGPIDVVVIGYPAT